MEELRYSESGSPPRSWLENPLDEVPFDDFGGPFFTVETAKVITPVELRLMAKIDKPAAEVVFDIVEHLGILGDRSDYQAFMELHKQSQEQQLSEEETDYLEEIRQSVIARDELVRQKIHSAADVFTDIFKSHADYRSNEDRETYAAFLRDTNNLIHYPLVANAQRLAATFPSYRNNDVEGIARLLALQEVVGHA